MEVQNLLGAYSLDVTSPGAGWFPVLARATAVSAQRSTDAVSVAFSVNDPNVHDGWIEFFDSRGTKLGMSQRLFGVLEQSLKRMGGAILIVWNPHN